MGRPSSQDQHDQVPSLSVKIPELYTANLASHTFVGRGKSGHAAVDKLPLRNATVKQHMQLDDADIC